jgi:antitoxin VapB
MPKNGHEPDVRTVRLYREGAGQVLHIPRDLEFDTAEATVRREGDRIIIEPVGAKLPPRKSLAELLDEWALDPLDEDDKFGDFDDFCCPACRR